MATTAKVLFNDFVAIERKTITIPCRDTNVFSGTVRAVSMFANQVATGDEVLYFRSYTYKEGNDSFDVAKQSDIILRNPIS